VRQGQFDAAFQPMVELHGGRILGYEALTRFRDGIGPEVRFAEAAALGLGADLELATLQKAIDASTQLPSGTFLSVNVTPNLVLERQDQISDVLQRSDRSMVLELTERRSQSGAATALIWLAGNAGGIVVAVLVQITQDRPGLAFSLLAATAALVLAVA